MTANMMPPVYIVMLAFVMPIDWCRPHGQGDNAAMARLCRYLEWPPSIE